MKQYELPGQSDKEVPCYDHPLAPHGFNRNASHSEGHYVCECKGWHDELISDAIYSIKILNEIHKDFELENMLIYLEGV